MATGSEGIILRDGEKFITDNVSRYRTRSDIFLSSFFFSLLYRVRISSLKFHRRN